MSGALEVALRVRAAMTQKPVKLGKPPRPKWPHREAGEYYRDLRAVLERLHEIVKRVVDPQLARIVAAHNVTRPEDEPIRTDSTGDTVEGLMEELEDAVDAEISPAKIEMLAQKNVVRVATRQGKEFQKQVEQVAKINIWGDTAGLVEHLEVAVAENVRLITSLKGKQLDDVKGIILRGARAGVHQTAIAEQIEQSFGVSKRRAALIANDQTGKLNGELNQIRQQRLGVRRYRWSSSQDERVRKRHRQLNGTIQEWGKPPITDERTGERAHPGQPIRCRCQPIPIIDDVLVDAGLMDPKDVDLGTPKSSRPLSVQPGLPKPPPANEPRRAVQPTVPKLQSGSRLGTPTLPQVPPANTPVGGGGGGSAGGGGGRGGPPAGPPGGRPPGPPSEPERQKLVGDLRAGLGALPAKGGHAPKVRGATQELLEHYGMVVRPNQPARAKLTVSPTYRNAIALLFDDGEMQLEPHLIRRIKSALAKLRRGAAASEAEADALSTLVHEELHATGPLISAYLDGGSLVEEVTTEVLARSTTRDLLGQKGAGRVHANHPLALPTTAIAARPYDEEIVGVLDDIMVVTGADLARATALLRQASLAFKQSSGELKTAEAAIERLVEGMPGLSATERARMEVALIQRGAAKEVSGVR